MGRIQILAQRKSLYHHKKTTWSGQTRQRAAFPTWWRLITLTDIGGGCDPAAACGSEKVEE